MLKLTPVKKSPPKSGAPPPVDILAAALGVETLTPPHYSYTPYTRYTPEYTEGALIADVISFPVRIKGVQTHRVHARHGVPMYYQIKFTMELIVDSAAVSSVKCHVFHIYKPSEHNEFIEDILNSCDDPKCAQLKTGDFIGVGMLDSNLEIDFEKVEGRGHNKRLRAIAYELMRRHGCAFLLSDAQSPKSAHILLKHFKFFAAPKSVVDVLKKEFRAIADPNIKRMLRDDARAVATQDPRITRRMLTLINAINCIVGAAANMVADMTRANTSHI